MYRVRSGQARRAHGADVTRLGSPRSPPGVAPRRGQTVWPVVGVAGGLGEPSVRPSVRPARKGWRPCLGPCRSEAAPQRDAKASESKRKPAELITQCLWQPGTPPLWPRFSGREWTISPPPAGPHRARTSVPERWARPGRGLGGIARRSSRHTRPRVPPPQTRQRGRGQEPAQPAQPARVRGHQFRGRSGRTLVGCLASALAATHEGGQHLNLRSTRIPAHHSRKEGRGLSYACFRPRVAPGGASWRRSMIHFSRHRFYHF